MVYIDKKLDSVFLDGISGGIDSVRFTLKVMSRLVSQFKRDITILNLARSIVAQVPQKKSSLEVSVIQQWVRDNIRYTRDVRGVETLQYPTYTAQTKHGDCDDQSVLTASLLEAVGYATRFVAVGKTMQSLCHVMTEVKLGDRWLTVETTENVPIGWRPPGYNSREIIYN